MASKDSSTGVIIGSVTASEGKGPIHRAKIRVSSQRSGEDQLPPRTAQTDRDGRFRIDGLAEGSYTVECEAFGTTLTEKAEVKGACPSEVCFALPVIFRMTALEQKGCELVECKYGTVGRPMILRAESGQGGSYFYEWSAPGFSPSGSLDAAGREMQFTPEVAGRGKVKVRMREQAIDADGGAEATFTEEFPIAEAAVQAVGGRIGVTFGRTSVGRTSDQALWVAIRARTKGIGFTSYRQFIDQVLCENPRFGAGNGHQRSLEEPGANVRGVGSFQLLKTATQAFLLVQCGVRINDSPAESRLFPGRTLVDTTEESRRLGESVTLDDLNRRLTAYLGDSAQLPYISRVISAAFPDLQEGSMFCDRVLTSHGTQPCLLELIWSYWNEEGMLCQTMNVLSRRFQNVRGPGSRDPLAHLEIDPLRPLNNLLWGYIQDEQNLLSVRRRGYEYDHHYGLTLYGKAVAPARTADSRSKFLEGFHNLLHASSVFFKEDNDTTVIADGYPLLNALKEVHLLLAEGAHNQFGDLPWTARAEMLMQQWLLARSEMRDFLQSRAMVPYKEAWMPQVDTMKAIQGWSDVGVTHYGDLASYGEQLLLSVRYGDWIDVNDEDSAKNWARYWRPEIQGYLHAYRAVTGIDLTNPDTVDATVPAVHMQKRLATQQRGR
jgi:hypothetical protein